MGHNTKQRFEVLKGGEE